MAILLIVHVVGDGYIVERASKSHMPRRSGGRIRGEDGISLLPSSPTSTGFSRRVRHEQTDWRTLPGNRTKGTFRSLKFLVQNQNTSKDILIFLSDRWTIAPSHRSHPSIPLLLRLSGFQREWVLLLVLVHPCVVHQWTDSL